jgi:hypothetical protein
MILFWCLMPKGEKLRPKQEWISYHLRILKISRVRAFVLSKYSYCLLLSKVGLLWGECLIMEKRGSFWIFYQFLLKYLSLCLNKWFWLRDRKLSLIRKNKPSGGKEWSKYAKFESKTNFCSHLHWCCTSLVAFCCVGINHQKGGDWKGNVPLGHFYKILVIKCSTQMLWVIFVPKTQEVQIKIKGMFLNLVHCFED